MLLVQSQGLVERRPDGYYTDIRGLRFGFNWLKAAISCLLGIDCLTPMQKIAETIPSY